MPVREDLPLTHLPKHEALARDPKFQEYLRAKRKLYPIARLMGRPYELVVAAARFAETGERPVTKPPGRRRAKGAPKRESLAKKHGAEVVRLKDHEGLKFGQIGVRLGISLSTAAAAYWAHLSERLTSASAGAGKRPSAKYSHLDPAALRKVRKYLAVGCRPGEVAGLTGVSVSTVRRVARAGSRHADGVEN